MHINVDQNIYINASTVIFHRETSDSKTLSDIKYACMQKFISECTLIYRNYYWYSALLTFSIEIIIDEAFDHNICLIKMKVMVSYKS